MAQDLVTQSGMQELADGLHAALGGLAIALPTLLFGTHAWYYSLPALEVFAAVKEFWWDLHYETAETSGGIKGGVRDFLGYTFGAAVVLVLLATKWAWTRLV